jgi:pimeloyl-ACP methyl ester carboxylesterase
MASSALGRLGRSLLGGLAFVCVPLLGRAADGEPVKFETFDKVDIHGTFYASPKGTKGPCALLLHPIGGNIHMEGWSELAAKLQKEGFAVLAFDFRGHGDSLNVDPLFWNDPLNRQLKSFRPVKPRDQINYKDFTNVYHYGTLVNDIVAAKRFLDKKNDSGECNSANVVVIGAESGATLGAMWIWYAWHYRRVSTGFPVVTPPANQVDGQDIMAAVWLSINPNLGNARVVADKWFRAPVREKVPMFFLYGDGDTKAQQYSRHLFENVLRAEKDKQQLKYTIMKPVKDTKLSGRELLGKPDLDTDKMIVAYLTKIVEAKGMNTYNRRDVEKTLLVRVPVQNYLP